MTGAPADQAVALLAASLEESTCSTGTNLQDLPTDILLDILEAFGAESTQSDRTQSPRPDLSYEYRSLSQTCR